MKRLALFGVALLVATACSFDFNIVAPKGPILGWCYSDSLKAARDSFPLCPPDSLP